MAMKPQISDASAESSRDRSARSARRRSCRASRRRTACPAARSQSPAASGTPASSGATDLDAGEDVLILSHVRSPLPQRQIGRLSHQSHHSGQPRGPERSADDDADGAPEGRRERQEQAETMNAERADRIADGVAEEGVFVLRRLHRLARPAGWSPTGSATPCSASARHVVKKNVIAIMCAGL